ncbi:immunoglobulin-like domain-containing protein, partial [Motilimonas eburnea]|uniref:immunoglobulin-like domain-containing protein n=1 Tax=Motilimonas eburnea TaxID=1737488 RepID=UPI001E50DF8C
DKAPATDLTVQVITGHITTDNGDVIAQTQDVVIKAGTTETVFTVDTLDDAYADNGEKFQVSLGNTTGGGYENLVKGTSVVETTINDQTGTDGNPGPEDTATISLSGDASVVEGESASYTVTVDKAPATDLTVQVITGHITTDNGDVIAQTQDVVIKAGTTETVFAVDTLDDAYADNGEKFQVSLGNTTGGGYENLVKGTSVVETTINDQTGTDGNPGPEDTTTINLSGASTVIEGDDASYKVSVDNAPASDLTVQVITGHITTDNGDVIAQTQDVVIKAGTTETVFTVATLDDAVKEVDEQFNVTLGTTTGGGYENLVKGNSAVTTTITDNDSSTLVINPASQANNVSVVEGNQAIFTVEVGKAALGSVVSLSLTDGTATAADYEASFEVSTDGGTTWTVSNGQVNLPNGGNQTILVRTQTIDDAYLEPNETYQLNATLVSGSDTLQSTGTATITDDSTTIPPVGADTATISLSGDASVVEGESASYTVTVDKAPATDLTVQVITGHITTDNGDVIAQTQDVVIKAGTTETVFAVDTLDDAYADNGEKFQVSLGNTTGGGYENLVKGTSVVETTINDQTGTDGNPGPEDTATISLSGDASVVEGESASYTVTVDKAPATDLTVQVITGHITTDNGDVIAQTQDVVIKAGTTETVFAVDTLDDAYADNGEKFQVSLGNTTGGGYENLVKGTSVVETTINDQTGTDGNPGPEDTATISLSGDTSVVEGESASYTVTVDKAPATDLTVQVITGHITTDNGDVIAQTQDVVIKAGTTETVFAVDTLDDAYADNGEQFQVSLGNTTGGGYENLVKGTSVVETTINDQTGTDGNPGPEDTATISLSGDASVVEGESASYTVTVDKAPASDLTVQVITGHITTDNGDVIAQTQDVVIKAGTTETVFAVDTLDDAYADNGEKFQVSLGNTTGGGYENLVKGTSVVETTINDQTGTDGNPGPEDTATISLSGDASVVEGESASYTVTVDKAPATDLTVQVITGHITTDNGDVIAQTQDVVIKVGTTETVFTVDTLDDAYADNGEKFQVSLGNTTGGGYENLVKGTSVVETTINDQTGTDGNPGPEDTAIVTLAGPTDVVEGEKATDYTLTLDTPVPDGKSVTINLQYSGKAADGTDFTGVKSVIITGPSNSATFDIQTIQDEIYEGAESFIVSIESIVDTDNAFENIVDKGDTVTTVIDDSKGVDNDLPSFTLTATDGSSANAVNEGEVAGYQITIGDKGVADGINVTLELKMTEGTALNPEDFTGLQGITFDSSKGVYLVTLTGPLAANSVVATLSASTVDDNEYESNEKFKVSLESTTLGSVSGEVETTILNNDAPVLAPVDVEVNEAGLIDGSNPGVGHVVSGNLLGTDDSLSISSIAGGVLDANTGIITVTTAQGVLTVETTGANAGQYQYQLNDTFSHQAGNGTNTADNANSFDITVSGHNGVTTNLTLNVDIIDDIPTANIVSPDPIDFTQQTTNLVFVLDVSGSMGWDMEGDRPNNANWGGTDRLTIAKQSLEKLIDAYSNLGDVNIKIVSFRHQVDVESDWLTLAEAKALLNTLNADNGTDYDDALRALVDGFNPPTKADGSAADLTKVYFLSDGVPNDDNDKQEIRDYESTWQTFVEDNNIEAEAIGIGSNVSTEYLDMVAHPTKADGSEPTQIVTTANGLLTVLLDSVKAVVTGDVDTKVTGSVATGIDYGADGGFIESIEVDGVTYNRPAGPDFKVKIDTQNGGELVFDFSSGEYTYVVTLGDKPANSDTFADNIVVNVVDNDGDKAKSDFDISVTFPVIDTTPVANLDTDLVTEASGQPDNASSAVINGNVLINDMYGEDVPAPVIGAAVGETVGNVSGGVGQVLVGEFGTLVLNSDGSYTYTLDNKNAQVQALDRNETLVDKFTYTITDDNGDLSSANLNITVRGVTDPMLDAVDDSASTFAGQPVYVDILNNDINPSDSDTADSDKEITIEGINVLNGAGQAYIVDGELVYIPGKTQETARIEYTITNDKGETDTAIVTINVTERDFTGSTLTGESGNDQITTVSGTDTGSKDFQLQLGGYNGFVTNPDGSRTFINVGARDERKVMSQEEQLIDSSGGNDYVKGSIGSDTIYLGDGFRETDEASTKAFLDKEALKDQAELDAYHTGSVSSSIVDIADGGAGDDIIYGGSQGVDDPNATEDGLERPISHYDYIYGNDGDDMIDGGLGYDVLRGGSGNDTIIGGLGDDDIAGNSGNDILIGGEGRDTFRFFAEDVILESGNDKQLSGNKDTIIDFNLNQDKLDLTDLLQGESENTIDQYLQATENANGGIDIIVDADGIAGGDTMTITLDGVRYSDAGAASGEDFIQKLIQDGNLIIDK